MTTGPTAGALDRPALQLAVPCAGVLLLALAGLAWLFRPEIAAAVAVWFDSTAYGHCFLVLPIAAWLAWDRREAARGLAPVPTPWPALAVIPLGLAWFVAERLGLMEGRQLAAVAIVVALVVALLGFRLARVFAAPLAYLVFLVPFGSFLVPSLQTVTADFIDVGLGVLGIPHAVDTFTIDIPEGAFYVAEACAGLRFLIAAIAFGALYACVTYSSPWKRLAFLAASMVVPILANGIRALGIVVAGHLMGNAEAAAADHLIYGWGFFSAVIVLLTLAGLPFRDPVRPLPAPPVARVAPPPFGHLLGVAALAVLLAAIAPAATLALDRPEAAPNLNLPAFAATPECRADGTAFLCRGVPLTASVAVLPPRASPAALRAALTHATGEQDAADAVTSTLVIDGAHPRAWRLVELHEPNRITATAVWIDGDPDLGGLAGRLRQAWNSVAGNGAPPVLVAATLRPDTLLRAQDREDADRVLHDFLLAQAPLLAAVTRATAAR
jgi:exosortase A